MSALHSVSAQVSAGCWSFPHKGQWIERVKLRQAERHPDMGVVASGFEKPSACGNTYQPA